MDSHSPPPRQQHDQRTKVELVRELHDVISGRVRMSASRFIELVRRINAAS